MTLAIRMAIDGQTDRCIKAEWGSSPCQHKEDCRN